MGNALESAYLGAENYLKVKLQSRRSNILNYEAIKEMIDRYGVSAMTSNRVTPLVYILIKTAMALFFGYLGTRIHILTVLPIGFLGFQLPNLIAVRSNQRDNKDMLDDLKNLYDILYIQLSSGEHITTVLSECYLNVKNQRLKMGLREMASTISGRHDIEDALLSLQSKFHNDYIDALVISILQSLKTGRAAQMFEDMSHQIEGMDKAIIVREKQNIQNKVLLFQVLMYMVIILTVVYVTCVGAASALSFSMGV